LQALSGNVAWSGPPEPAAIPENPFRWERKARSAGWKRAWQSTQYETGWHRLQDAGLSAAATGWISMKALRWERGMKPPPLLEVGVPGPAFAAPPEWQSAQ
jgi:hypothetical protein